jgi:hypothetical protein
VFLEEVAILRYTKQKCQKRPINRPIKEQKRPSIIRRYAKQNFQKRPVDRPLIKQKRPKGEVKETYRER